LWVTAPKGWLTLFADCLDPDVDVSAMLHQVDGVLDVFVGFVDGDNLAGFVGGCDLVVHLVSSSLALLCIL